MFKSSVAWVLNKYLGKYVQDLDTENLNVGIFNGEVQLHDLKLKPEALYELKLPIEVREGQIGTVSLNIPWNAGILNQPVILTIEDVFIVAGAVVGDIFDAELEKRLIRARKKRILDELEEASLFGTDGTSEGLFEKLATNLARNMQIYIRNVHIRYEDTTSIPDSPVSCGLCLQSISIETTNSKWKPSSTPPTSSSTYQLLRVQSLSFYWNSCTHSNGLVLTSGNWRQSMHQGLQSFSINGEEFEFILKPVSAKAKLIITRSNEAKVPKLLLDVVLQDTVVQISRAQYTSMVALQEAFQRIDRNREYREHHPGVHLHKNASLWWKYALSAVLEQRVRPYSWLRIKKHRDIYREYVSAYTLALLRPSDTELKIDLQKLEDQLQVIDLVIAREQAKIELSKKEPESLVLVTAERWWLGLWKCVDPEMKFKMVSDSKQGFWSRLTSQEKEKLFELIEYSDGQNTAKPKQYIEHKYNLTLANLSLSLMCHGQEIALASISQFLVSLETRPVASAFKFSARAENFLLEGLSSDNELIPLIQADSLNSDTSVTTIFAFDFEKNPVPKEADFSITMRLEPMEIIYNEHTLSELIGFFQTIALKEISEENMEDMINKTREMGMHFLRQKKRVYLNLNLKGPTIVVPEQGSIQRGGNVLIVDTGCLKVSTDLQSGPLLIEEETKTELEEHLYDRLTFELSGVQIMYCDCSDEWREKRKIPDSDLHLFSGTKIQLMISNSVKPEYKQLPRHKMNLSVNSIKLNMSNRRVNSLLDFMDTFPLPNPVSIHSSHYDETPDHLSCQFLADVVPQPAPIANLRLIRSSIVLAHLTRLEAISDPSARHRLPLSTAEMDKMLSSSDQSDEEIEVWAKTMDQPGFEDNVSPNNSIEVLLRFLLGEFVINFSKSENKVDVPYLMLRLEKVCIDSALLEYGPAVQFTVGSFQLVDKIHTCAGGCYIELVSGSAPAGFEMLSILYRKVKANCPDFKTHFHSVEHSMVFDMQNLSILFHREAFAAHLKYFNVINKNITKHDSAIGSMLSSSMTSVRETITTMSTLSLSSYFALEEDPPVPSGATKLSYSVRVGDVKLRLCNTDLDFLDLKISGFETDCLIKANERTVHRLFLNSIHLEDLSDMTLYSKILFLDGDHLLDVKYVLHSPRICAKSGIESTKDHIKSDGTLKAHLGRLNVIYLHRFGMDILNFLEPFIDLRAIMHKIMTYLAEQLSKMKHFAVKLQLALDLAIPTLLIPQKSDSPNLLILNMGQLKVENFFKWDEHLGTHSVAIDNILAKLDGVQISRAIMTLAGTVEAQEPILEPTTFNFDFKRRGNLKTPKKGRSPVPLCQISGSAENIVMNLGQKDLATILLTYQENIAEGVFAELHPRSAQMSPVECCDHAIFHFQQADDTPIRKLQLFLGQNKDDGAELELSFVIESLELTLFKDIDEVLSSPVRDLTHALCRFKLAELTTSMTATGYGNYTIKHTMQTCVIKDIVKESNLLEQKAYIENKELLKEANKLQPFIECTIQKSAAGTWSNEIIVESYIMNLPIQFLANLANFLIEATPVDKTFDGGVVNYGYIGDLTCNRVLQGTKNQLKNRMTDKISISVRLRQSEINLLSESAIGCILCLQSEIVMDYNFEPDGVESSDFMVSRVQITLHEEDLPSQVVLQSCDLEYSKRMQSISDGIKINVSVSPVNFCISSKVAKILCGIAEDISNVTQAKEPCKFSRMPSNFQELENLWTPKKIPVCVPCTDDTSSFKLQLSPEMKISESLFFSISRISILFQLEGIHKRNPLLQVKSSVTAEIQDWSSQMELVSQFQLQASYFNESLRKWEPLIEPINDGSILRPWEISIQLFHAKAFSLSSVSNQAAETRLSGKRPRAKNAQEVEKSESNMTFVKKQCAEFSGPLGSSPSKRKRHSSSDSDPENVDQYLNKLSELIGYLVCDDNESESDDNSKDEQSDDMHLSEDTEEGHVRKLSCQANRDSLATYVLICAQQRLEIALSCAAIGVMNTFLSSFLGDAEHLELSTQFSKELDIQNHIGPSSTVTLCGRLNEELSEDGEYVVLATAHYEICESERNSPEMLEVVDERFNKEAAASAAVLTPTYKDDTAACWYHRITSTKITVDVEGFSKLNVLVPQRSTSSIHPLHPSKHDTIYHVAVTVDHKLGSKIVSVQSPLSVCNYTSHALSLYYRKSALTELGIKLIGETVNPFQDLVRVAVIGPNETYCVPLYVAYHSKLFIHPAYMENCSVSETSLWWKDFAAKPHQEVQCLAKQDTGEVMFSLHAICNQKHECKSVNDNLVPNYMVKLLPPMTIHNYLPLSIEIFLPATERQLRIETGTSADMYELGATVNKKVEIKITSYLSAAWNGELMINPKTKEKAFPMSSENASQRFMVNTRVYNEENCNLYLYTTHWVVNKCGVPLLLKGASSKDLYQLNDEEPVVVNLNRNQDIQLKVCQSNWSKMFSLNAAGTSGVVICHDHERGNKVYRLHVSTSFSQSCPALTKIITIVPYFMVMNNCRKHLRFMEDNEMADLWIDLSPSKCVPFWPETTTMRIFVKFRDGKVVSQNVPINWSHTTVLKMDKGCGLTVKVSGGAEAPFTIVFNNFGPGEAPIRIDNLCELVHIKVHQPNTVQNAVVLNPYQSILYTWDDPCKERILQWNASSAKSKDISLDIWKDGFGVQKVQVLSEQPPSTPPAVVQTSSSSSMSSKITAGLRRLSKPSFDAASKLNDDSSETSEIFIYWVSFLESGQRVLLLTTDADTALRTKSMIDPEKGSFELILSLTGVGVSLATDPDNPTQELAYVSAQESAPSWEVLVSRGWCPMPFELAAWCEEKFTQKVSSAKLKTLMHIDLEKMQLIKPFFAELRRVQNPAIWMQYRRSPRQVYVHWKLHHLQVDNQLPEAQNPTILSPLPSLKGAQQPCFEATVFYQHYNSQTVYKYLRVIFGSLRIDADKVFFSKVLRSLEQRHNFHSLESMARADVTFAHQPFGLKQYQILDHDCLIENLFISPLTIQIRYVPTSSSDSDLKICQVSNKITALFESLDDIQDEHLFSLRLQSCEVYGMSLPLTEMVGSIYKHYSMQAHQQYYASVLGLNVLTNPYDLITDMGIVEGVWKGPQIGGAEPFSEGIAFGAKAMLGYAIGASSWHFVPGCDASENLISFSRKELLNQAEQRVLAPQEIQKYEHALSKAFLGVNGLFYEDKSDGAGKMEIFCKGTGSRFMDMIEAGDIVSPFTTTEYAIRRLIDFGELSMATRIRMPKYTNPYLGFRPYSDYEAIGHNLLCCLIKDLNLPSETYWAHAPLNLDSTSIALITIQRVYVLTKAQLWGSWTVENNIPIVDLVSVPQVASNKLIFTSVKDTEEVCTVETEDALVAEWLQNKIETAMIAAMEEKPCPSTI